MASEIPPQRSSLGPVSVHRGTVIALSNQLSFGTDQEGTPPSAWRGHGGENLGDLGVFQACPIAFGWACAEACMYSMSVETCSLVES